MACRGVSTIRGSHVTATGWVSIAGTHVVRRDLKTRLERRGAIFQSEFNLSTEVLVLGHLRHYQLHDDRVGGVDAIDQLWRSRQAKLFHVHLVHHDDLADLLDGETVPCGRVPADWDKFKKYLRESIRRGQQGT